MRKWDTILCREHQTDLEKVMIKLVCSLSVQDDYSHMTAEEIYIEHCALAGVNTGD